MGLALSRTDDNNMSTLHHIYAKDKSFIRQHNARKVARRLSKSMIGKPSHFKHTHHIGSGDYQENHAVVQEQIAEITVIFNATNKPLSVTRKPVNDKHGHARSNSNSRRDIARTPPTIRKTMIRKELPSRVFSQSMQNTISDSRYHSRSVANLPDVRRAGLESMSCTSLDHNKTSLYSLAEQRRQLDMLKGDVERMSGSEHNLRKYAACNHLLQLAPSRESFVC